MAKIRTYYLPQSIYDFHTAINAIPAFLQQETLVNNQVWKAKRDHRRIVARTANYWERVFIISLSDTIYYKWIQ